VHPDTRLSSTAVEMLTGMSRPTLYRHSKAGTFPRQVAPGRWNGGAVFAYLSEQSSGERVA
jgi:predicted DNA-binding transcriptional regulator AlpA